jgi:Lipocalin-like domain
MGLQNPDQKKEHHESRHFGCFRCVSANFSSLSAREEEIRQTAKELLGTWTLVSITLEQDGKKTDFYGPNPQGQATFDPNGRVSIIFIRSDLPKFAYKDGQAGTPEENKAVVQGGALPTSVRTRSTRGQRL